MPAKSSCRKVPRTALSKEYKVTKEAQPKMGLFARITRAISDFEKAADLTETDILEMRIAAIERELALFKAREQSKQ